MTTNLVATPMTEDLPLSKRDSGRNVCEIIRGDRAGQNNSSNGDEPSHGSHKQGGGDATKQRVSWKSQRASCKIQMVSRQLATWLPRTRRPHTKSQWPVFVVASRMRQTIQMGVSNVIRLVSMKKTTKRALLAKRRALINDPVIFLIGRVAWWWWWWRVHIGDSLFAQQGPKSRRSENPGGFERRLLLFSPRASTHTHTGRGVASSSFILFV